MWVIGFDDDADDDICYVGYYTPLGEFKRHAGYPAVDVEEAERLCNYLNGGRGEDFRR